MHQQSKDPNPGEECLSQLAMFLAAGYLWIRDG